MVWVRACLQAFGRHELRDAGTATDRNLMAVQASRAAVPGGAVAGVIRGAKLATQIARQGGRLAGQLREFLKQTPGQLKRTVRSFDMQISKHEGWMADPSSKVSNFSQLSPEYQQNVLHHWGRDIARQQELRSIAQDVLKGF